MADTEDRLNQRIDEHLCAAAPAAEPENESHLDDEKAPHVLARLSMPGLHVQLQPVFIGLTHAPPASLEIYTDSECDDERPCARCTARPFNAYSFWCDPKVAVCYGRR